MLEDTPVKPVSQLSYILIILLWGGVIGIVCRTTSIMIAAVSVVTSSVLYLFAAAYLFKLDGTWYPIVIPLFAQSPLAFAGAVLWNYAETNKERQQIRKALAYYVPDEVVDQLAKNMVDIKNSGRWFTAHVYSRMSRATPLCQRRCPHNN